MFSSLKIMAAQFKSGIKNHQPEFVNAGASSSYNNSPMTNVQVNGSAVLSNFSSEHDGGGALKKGFCLIGCN